MLITERLKTRLVATSTVMKIQLGTMHGQSLVDSAIVKDLVVTDLNGKNPVELPRAYTRQEIPADTKQIRTPEIVDRIEQLNHNLYDFRVHVISFRCIYFLVFETAL